MIVPNPHIQTPEYSIKRVRTDEIGSAGEQGAQLQDAGASGGGRSVRHQAGKAAAGTGRRGADRAGDLGSGRGARAGPVRRGGRGRRAHWPELLRRLVYLFTGKAAGGCGPRRAGPRGRTTRRDAIALANATAVIVIATASVIVSRDRNAHGRRRDKEGRRDGGRHRDKDRPTAMASAIVTRKAPATLAVRGDGHRDAGQRDPQRDQSRDQGRDQSRAAAARTPARTESRARPAARSRTPGAARTQRERQREQQAAADAAAANAPAPMQPLRAPRRQPAGVAPKRCDARRIQRQWTVGRWRQRVARDVVAVGVVVVVAVVAIANGGQPQLGGEPSEVTSPARAKRRRGTCLPRRRQVSPANSRRRPSRRDRGDVTRQRGVQRAYRAVARAAQRTAARTTQRGDAGAARSAAAAAVQALRGVVVGAQRCAGCSAATSSAAAPGQRTGVANQGPRTARLRGPFSFLRSAAEPAPQQAARAGLAQVEHAFEVLGPAVVRIRHFFDSAVRARTRGTGPRRARRSPVSSWLELGEVGAIHGEHVVEALRNRLARRAARAGHARS